MTGEILEIYEQPTGPTDAISMQHDVDYSVCEHKGLGSSCKREADCKMVKALDAVPKKERQWGHAIARNMINSKQKTGMGIGDMMEPMYFYDRPIGINPMYRGRFQTGTGRRKKNRDGSKNKKGIS